MSETLAESVLWISIQGKWSKTNIAVIQNEQKFQGLPLIDKVSDPGDIEVELEQSPE